MNPKPSQPPAKPLSSATSAAAEVMKGLKGSPTFSSIVSGASKEHPTPSQPPAGASADSWAAPHHRQIQEPLLPAVLRVVSQILTLPRGGETCSCYLCRGSEWMRVLRNTGLSCHELFLGTTFQAPDRSVSVTSRWVQFKISCIWELDLLYRGGWEYQAEGGKVRLVQTDREQRILLQMWSRTTSTAALEDQTILWGAFRHDCKASDAPCEHVLWPEVGTEVALEGEARKAIRLGTPAAVKRVLLKCCPPKRSSSRGFSRPMILTSFPVDIDRMNSLLGGRADAFPVTKKLLRGTAKAACDEDLIPKTPNSVRAVASVDVMVSTSVGMSCGSAEYRGQGDEPAFMVDVLKRISRFNPELTSALIARLKGSAIPLDPEEVRRLLSRPMGLPVPDSDPQFTALLNHYAAGLQGPPPAWRPSPRPCLESDPLDGQRNWDETEPATPTAPAEPTQPGAFQEPLEPQAQIHPPQAPTLLKGDALTAVARVRESFSALGANEHLLLQGLQVQLDILTQLSAARTSQQDALESLIHELEGSRGELRAVRDEVAHVRQESAALQESLEAALSGLAKAEAEGSALRAEVERLGHRITNVQPSNAPHDTDPGQPEKPCAPPKDPAPPPSSPQAQEESLPPEPKRIEAPGRDPDRLGREEAGTSGNEPQYFTRMLTPLLLEDVAESYRAWILGIIDAKLRQNRLRQGVSKDWTTDTLRDHRIDLEGDRGVRVSVRSSTDETLFRFSHPDAEFGADLSWINLTRVRRTQAGTEIEHAILRVSSRPMPSRAAGVPFIVKGLLKQAEVQAPWEDWRPVARQYHKDNVKDLLTILTHPERDVPVVLIACDRESGYPLIFPDALAEELYGVASVYTPTRDSDPFLLSKALAEAGMDRTYSLHTHKGF